MILTEDGDDDGKDGGCGTHGGRQVTGSTFPVGGRQRSASALMRRE